MLTIHYSLSLDDHLAWYDFYCTTPHGESEKSSLPLIGKYLDRTSRESFGRAVSGPENKTAFGERSLELGPRGVREFSSSYDFTIAWPDIAMVAITDTHLFIAHASMNAHIVPLRAFSKDEDRIAFIRHTEALRKT